MNLAVLLDFLKTFLLTLPPTWFFIHPALSMLMVSHGLLCGWDLRHQIKPSDFPLPLVQGIIATFLVNFSGTTLVAMLLGRPAGWLSSETVVMCYLVLPLLVLYSPMDIVFRMLKAMRGIILPIVTFFDAIAITNVICLMGVDAVRNHPSRDVALTSSVIGMFICGVLAGCGGTLLNSAFGLTKRAWTFQAPEFVIRPANYFKLCVFIAGSYILMTEKKVWQCIFPCEPLFSKLGLKVSLPLFERDNARALLVLAALFYCYLSRFGGLSWLCSCCNRLCAKCKRCKWCFWCRSKSKSTKPSSPAGKTAAAAATKSSPKSLTESPRKTEASRKTEAPRSNSPKKSSLPLHESLLATPIASKRTKNRSRSKSRSRSRSPSPSSDTGGPTVTRTLRGRTIKTKKSDL